MYFTGTKLAYFFNLPRNLFKNSGKNIFALTHVDTEHGEVVVRFGAVTMCLHHCSHFLNHLFGLGVLCLAQLLYHALFAKLLLLGVFGLVETIGIEEQGASLDSIDFLAFELQVLPQAYGRI